jgi:hypothetical protein
MYVSTSISQIVDEEYEYLGSMNKILENLSKLTCSIGRGFGSTRRKTIRTFVLL